MKIRKGDTVKVLIGKDAGKIAKVIKVMPKNGKILVENVNVVKKHQKGDGRTVKSGVVEKLMPIDVSNVILVCPHCGETTRVGFKKVDGDHKFRICKKCKKLIDKQEVPPAKKKTAKVAKKGKNLKSDK